MGSRLLPIAVAALLLAPSVAEARFGTREEAIELCRREMSSRFGRADVRVEQVHRVSRRGDRLSVHARMRVRRVGNDIRRDVDCAVEFSGRRARVVAFSTDRDAWGGGWGSGGWGGGGGDERAARICWREAQSVGYPVNRVLSVRPAERGGSVVVLRSGHNDEVHCLYRNGVRDLRYRRR